MLDRIQKLALSSLQTRSLASEEEQQQVAQCITGGGGRSAGSSLCSFASASAASRLSCATRCAASATVSGSGRRASATAYAGHDIAYLNIVQQQQLLAAICRHSFSTHVALEKLSK